MASGILYNDVKWHGKPDLNTTIAYEARRDGGSRDPYVQYVFNYTLRMPSGNSNFYGASNSGHMAVSVDGQYGETSATGQNTGAGVGWSRNGSSINLTAYNTNTSGASGTSLSLWCRQNYGASGCTAGRSYSANIFGQTTGPYGGTLYPTVYYPAYVSDIPPTNIQGGRVYNQNGVVNGDNKLDWEFYVDWWGESGGTYVINQYNLNMYINGQGVALQNVTKWTRYNIETYWPKCKVGETCDFYMDTHVAGIGWLGNVYIGSIKLYKDGIIWIKDLSGIKREGTMAYTKDLTGNRRTARYALVKDLSGAQRVVDIYTTHYE